MSPKFFATTHSSISYKEHFNKVIQYQQLEI